jgi:hypothetical protein
VSKSDWYWSGYAGHFIGARNCGFVMHTRVGNFRISTVGDYTPYQSKEKMETIGAGEDSFFETYVFRVRDSEHPEGEIEEWSEIDGERYAESREAEAGHYKYCEKYDKIGEELNGK